MKRRTLPLGFFTPGMPMASDAGMAALTGKRDFAAAQRMLAAQRQIAARMQDQAFVDVPYMPVGQFFQPTAYRRTLTGVLNGFATFWNVRRDG